MSAHHFRVAALRKGAIRARGIGDAVHPITTIALGQRPSPERHRWGLLLILVNAQAAQRVPVPATSITNVARNLVGVG
jgi:hypothetical protein